MLFRLVKRGEGDPGERYLSGGTGTPPFDLRCIGGNAGGNGVRNKRDAEWNRGTRDEAFKFKFKLEVFDGFVLFEEKRRFFFFKFRVDVVEDGSNIDRIILMYDKDGIF